MAKCVFEGLRKEVDYICDDKIDLEDFINRYEEASNFYRRIKNLKYFKENADGSYNNHLFDLLDMVYKTNRIQENLPLKAKQFITYIYDEENDVLLVDVCMLVMIAIKALPIFNEGGEFYSSHETGTYKEGKNSIQNCFQIVIRFLKNYLKHIGYDTILNLDILERVAIETPKTDDSLERYSAIPIMNSITLYWHMSSILNQIDITEHQDKTKKSTEVARENQLFPNISGIWSKDKSGTSYSYWKIEETNWGYKVYICNTCDNEIEYDSAEMYLFDYTGNYYDNNWIRKKKEDEHFSRNLYSGFMMYSEFLLSQLNDSEPPIDKLVFNFICYINTKDGCPFSIEFFPIVPTGSFKHCTYYRMAENCQIIKIDNLLKKKFIGFKYQCRRCLVAVTWEYLYLGNMEKSVLWSDKEQIPDIKYKSFYKIPKALNTSFYDYNINSNLCLLVASFKEGERKYIAAPDSLDYYDITTEKSMKTYGIKLVDRIDQV